MKKKLLFSLLLAILCVLIFGAVNASAATYGDLTYKISNGEVTITGYNVSASSELIIPDTIAGYPVTTIGYGAFYECKSLTSVTIGNSVTTIGEDAFIWCKSLARVTIPDSVTTIGEDAFLCCNSLTSVTIGNSVTTIGECAFCSCDSLTKINVSTNNKSYSSINGVLFNKNATKLIQYPIGKYNNSYTIPDSVTTIGEDAFHNCDSLTSVTIPDSVTTIGSSAFSYCSSLTNVTIGDSVKTIGSSAFSECDSLTSVTIPDSVTSIGDCAFYDCDSLASVTIGNSVTTIGYEAFYNCSKLKNVKITDIAAWCNISFGGYSSNPLYYANNLYLNGTLVTNLVIPDSVKTIGNYAFYYCDSLASVTIPDSVTSIGDCAFYYCDSLTSVTIGNSVTTIGYEAFYHCSKLKNVKITDIVAWCNISFDNYSSNPLYYANNLYLNGTLVTNLVIPDSVTTIGEYAFYSCDSLTSVTIPDSVTTIGEYAFYSCDSLTSVTIGDSVTTIGEDAFYSCDSLTSVYITDIAAWCNISFDDYSSNPLCYAHNLYLNGTLVTNLVIPDSVKTIGNYAFFSCDSLTSVTIPDSVTTIGSSAFSNCDSLTSVTIPDSVTTIGERAFSYCFNLTEINVSTNNKSYSSIDGVLFNKNATILIQYPIGKTNNSYTISDGVKTIGEYAFYHCLSLTSITIPDSVTIIGERAFYYCDSLTSVTIGNSVTTIGYEAFYHCNSLKDVYYNGTGAEWKKISIGSSNTTLTNATRHYFFYVTIYDENNNIISKKTYEPNQIVNISDLNKYGYTIHIYTDKDCTQEFDIATTPITKNLVLHLRYIKNKYIAKFVDEDGTILSEETLEHGTTIIAPASPSKPNTAQYTYTFTGWEGYSEGMTIEKDVTFTAKYTTTINKYRYKFVDSDGAILSDTEANYGTTIILPNNPADKGPYTFDHWQGYTEGMQLTGDSTFTAIYRYKQYIVTAEGLAQDIIVTYNDNYTIPVQSKTGYNFIGYYTEKDGKGTKITDEYGNSITAYDTISNLKVYPYFISVYMNNMTLSGETKAELGDTITQIATFATDKNISYITATIKYPKVLTFKKLSAPDFAEASVESEETKNGYHYLHIIGVYDYNKTAPVNTNMVPFEIQFEVATDATIGDAEISLENVCLIGDIDIPIDDVTNSIVTICPKLAESMTIAGSDSIDKATTYTAIIYPDYTTSKEVIWYVDDDTVATISQEGVLTPVRTGVVTITATTKDGSGVLAYKTVSIVAYAKIDTIRFDKGVVNIAYDPELREYTVYVDEDADSITLTPTFTDGILRPNGSGLWISGRSKMFSLTDDTTIITLNRESVEGMTNSDYVINVVKVHIETDISTDGKDITVTPVNIDKKCNIIMAVYNDGIMTEIQNKEYTGEAVDFSTEEEYTEVKIMLWDGKSGLRPMCKAKVVK